MTSDEPKPPGEITPAENAFLQAFLPCAARLICETPPPLGRANDLEVYRTETASFLDKKLLQPLAGVLRKVPGLALTYATTTFWSLNETPEGNVSPSPGQAADSEGWWLPFFPTCGQPGSLRDYSALLTIITGDKSEGDDSLLKGFSFTSFLCRNKIVTPPLVFEVVLSHSGEPTQPPPAPDTARPAVDNDIPGRYVRLHCSLEQVPPHCGHRNQPSGLRLWPEVLEERFLRVSREWGPLKIDSREIATHDQFKDDLAKLTSTCEHCVNYGLRETQANVQAELERQGVQLRDPSDVAGLARFLNLYALMPETRRLYAFPSITRRPEGDTGSGSTPGLGCGCLIIGLSEGELSPTAQTLVAGLVAIAYSKLETNDYAFKRSQQESARVTAVEEAKKLAIVAGTSHAFKNLLMPLKGGLNITRRPVTKHAIEAFRDLKGCLVADLDDAMAEREVILANPALQWDLLHTVSELERYSVIVNRLWGKIYALHLTSMTPETFRVSRVSRQDTLSNVVLTSFYTSWYSFSRDPVYDIIRAAHTCRSHCTVAFAINIDGTPYANDFTFSPPASTTLTSQPGSRHIAALADIPSASEGLGDPKFLLPAILLEAIFEEVTFNAIKYGALEQPILCRISQDPASGIHIFVQNTVNPGMRGLNTLGHGVAFLEILARVCRATVVDHSHDPDREATWRFEVEHIPNGSEQETDR